MYKKVLVPIDISHLERVDAMVAAARMLSPDGEIILMNAVETIPAYVQAEIPVNFVGETIERSRTKLDEIAKGLSGKVTTEIGEGHAASAILNLAEEQKVDAIVVASHKPGWQDYLIGSTAARVVRHAKCNVMVMR